MTPETVYARVFAAVEAGAAAVVPALPVTDTIKRSFDGVHADETLDYRPAR